jgi:hypothetical protein
MSKRLWVSDNGSVTCDEHAGTYLRCAIEARPKAKSHCTPLDNWSMYFEHLLGGLPCETCVDWSTLVLEAK